MVFFTSFTVKPANHSKWTYTFVVSYSYPSLMKIKWLTQVSAGNYLVLAKRNSALNSGIRFYAYYTHLVSTIHRSGKVLCHCFSHVSEKKFVRRRNCKQKKKNPNKINLIFFPREYLWNVLFQSFSMTVYQPESFSKLESLNLYAVSEGWEES